MYAQISVASTSSTCSPLECPGAPLIVQHPRFMDHYYPAPGDVKAHKLKRVRTITKSAGLRLLEWRKMNTAEMKHPDINGLQLVADSRWPKPKIHESLFLVSKSRGTTSRAVNPIDKLHHVFTPPASHSE